MPQRLHTETFCGQNYFMIENLDLRSACKHPRIDRGLDLQNEYVGSNSRDIGYQYADFNRCNQKHSDSPNALTPDIQSKSTNSGYLDCAGVDDVIQESQRS